ncbi:MAG: collagen-binding domain-containing protein [Acidimicrobiales bacterium]
MSGIALLPSGAYGDGISPPSCISLNSYTGISNFGSFAIFTGGNYTTNHGDAVGAVGVGGLASLNTAASFAYTIGGPNQGSLPGGGYSLVAPDLAGTSKIAISSGNVAYASNSGTPTIYNNGQGVITSSGVTSTSPLDFGVAMSGLSKASSDFASEPSTMTLSSSDPTHLVLTGAGGQNDVYNGPISSLAPSPGSTLTISDKASTTVVINITDVGAVDLSKLATINLTGGLGAPTVMWNFPNATSLTFGTTQWEGTILAPQAFVIYQNAQVDGSIYVDSLLGGTEVEHVGFTGTYCPPTTPTTDGGTTTSLGPTTTIQAPTTTTLVTPVTQPSSGPSTTMASTGSGGSTPSTSGTSATLLTSSNQPSTNGTVIVAVPSAATGEPWSGPTYWYVVISLGLTGVILFGSARRREQYEPHTASKK